MAVWGDYERTLAFQRDRPVEPQSESYREVVAELRQVLAALDLETVIGACHPAPRQPEDPASETRHSVLGVSTGYWVLVLLTAEARSRLHIRVNARTSGSEGGVG